MILGILQARASSRRLPGKVLKSILGRPMLERQIERLRRARRLDRLVVATSTDAGDCPLADPAVIDQLIDMHLTGGFDYTSNVEKRSYPDGLDAEVMKFHCL